MTKHFHADSPIHYFHLDTRKKGLLHAFKIKIPSASRELAFSRLPLMLFLFEFEILFTYVWSFYFWYPVIHPTAEKEKVEERLLRFRPSERKSCIHFAEWKLQTISVKLFSSTFIAGHRKGLLKRSLRNVSSKSAQGWNTKTRCPKINLKRSSFSIWPDKS